MAGTHPAEQMHPSPHPALATTAALSEMAEARDRALAEAREALYLREQFLTAAAHELRTPLTSLRGYAQLLQHQFSGLRPPDPARVQRALRLIDLQSERLSRLVRQLLDLSRAQTQELVLDYEEIEIAGLIEGVLDDCRAMLDITAPTSSVEHTFHLDAPEPVVAQVDRARLEQVLFCLVENAIKYSPHGGAVEVAVHSSNHSHFSVAVRDHGLGVPRDERDRLFERFFQSPRRAAAGGMGLGLYLSREIIRQHGGTIGVEFPEDGGTRFVLILPLTPTTMPEA